MNTKLKFTLIISLLLFIYDNRAVAQVVSLKMGDQLPDITLTGLYNTPVKEINLRNLKGKVVIIDFWTTYCGGCIAILPRMDSLQKKYGDQILILPVTYQSKAVVDKFWKNNPNVNKLNLPMVVGDTILHKLFPHTGVPFELWFDQVGRYLSSTLPEYINETEITALLKGIEPDWVKIVQQIKHDFSKTLLKPQKVQDTSSCFYSVFLNPDPGEKPDFNYTVDSLHHVIKVTCINDNIMSLYSNSLDRFPEFKYSKRLMFNVHDKSRLRYSKRYGYKSRWDLKNTFRYELVWPLDSAGKIKRAFDKMRADLDSFLGYTSTIRLKDTECYELVKISNRSGRYKGSVRTKRSVSLSTVVEMLNVDDDFPVVLNGNEHTDDIYINYNPYEKPNLSVLQQQLRLAGFELKKEKTRLAFFVLSDL